MLLKNLIQNIINASEFDWQNSMLNSGKGILKRKRKEKC